MTSRHPRHEPAPPTGPVDGAAQEPEAETVEPVREDLSDAEIALFPYSPQEATAFLVTLLEMDAKARFQGHSLAAVLTAMAQHQFGIDIAPDPVTAPASTDLVKV